MLRITVQFFIPSQKTFYNRHNLIKTNKGFFSKIKKDTVFVKDVDLGEPFYVIHESSFVKLARTIVEQIYLVIAYVLFHLFPQF